MLLSEPSALSIFLLFCEQGKRILPCPSNTENLSCKAQMATEASLDRHFRQVFRQEVMGVTDFARNLATLEEACATALGGACATALEP